MCELNALRFIQSCSRIFDSSPASLANVFQNLPASKPSFLTIPSTISQSSSPGVHIWAISNPVLSNKDRTDAILKKFRWCGGETLFDFSHNNRISNPPPLRVVRNRYPSRFNNLL